MAGREQRPRTIKQPQQTEARLLAPPGFSSGLIVCCLSSYWRLQGLVAPSRKWFNG
jgi:hypothetical protein